MLTKCVWFALFCVALANARSDGGGGDDNDDNNNKSDDGKQFTSIKVNNYDVTDDGGYEAAFRDEKDDEQPLQYESSHRSNSYKSNSHKKYQKQTLAKVIPLEQAPQRLDEIYERHQPEYQKEESSGNSSQDSSKQKILLYIKFARDWPQWSPRNPNSVLKFGLAGTTDQSSSGSNLADNAAFQLVTTNRKNAYGNEQQQNVEYGSDNRNSYNKHQSRENNDYVQLTSLPFNGQVHNEGYVASKQNFAVGQNERLLGRMKMSCKAIGVEQNPFNSTEVANAPDDPRLDRCKFQMDNVNHTTPSFWFAATNKGVWAYYASTTFVAARKVGVRDRYDSIVDVGLEMDRRRAAVNYYLNGYLVWTISAIGVPPPNDGITHIDYGTLGLQQIVTISQVSFAFGTGKSLDQSDPNQPNNFGRLVRIYAPNSPYYSSDSVFYDPDGLRDNRLWGQGAKMNLYKWVVVKTESRTAKQGKALSGVDGEKNRKANGPCAAQLATSGSSGPLIGGYIPQCDENTGLYETRQCSGSTGFCWCADPLTNARLNEPYRPWLVRGNEPNCDALAQQAMARQQT